MSILSTIYKSATEQKNKSIVARIIGVNINSSIKISNIKKGRYPNLKEEFSVQDLVANYISTKALIDAIANIAKEGRVSSLKEAIDMLSTLNYDANDYEILIVPKSKA